MSRLPQVLLRKMAGPPVEARGYALDPMMQVIWNEGKKQPGLEGATPEEARAGLEDAARMLQAPVPGAVSVRESTIPGPAGDLPMRIYAPKGSAGDLPIVIFFHFGGYVIGSRNICDGFCGVLSARANCVVVNVEYRLAPEHPFPAPVEDALAAYRWVLENGTALGGDASRVAVAGDSAGGQLAAVISQEAKRQGWAIPACQVLIYPWLVPDSGLASYADFADAYPLTADIMAWFGGHYFTEEAQKSHAWAAPLNEPELGGLPPALIYTAGFDPLQDEGKAYAERLEEAGVEVSYKCFEPLTHSFSMFGGVLPAAQAAMVEIAGELARRLHA